MELKKIVIIGATSAIAEHCARLWINQTSVLTLIARNQQKLDTVANDLQIRNPQVTINKFVLDFLDPEVIKQNIQKICEGEIDIVLIAHGFLPDQITAQNDLQLIEETISINTLSPIWFCESFIQYLNPNRNCQIAVISSIAGDRAKRSNYIYGSAKALLSFYIEGLQLRLENSKIKMVLIKPGPTSTPMTSHLYHQKFAKPEEVASDIVEGMKKQKSVIYTPYKWRFIMFIIRFLPNWIFTKIAP